jgi:hypothetical protein
MNKIYEQLFDFIGGQIGPNKRFPTPLDLAKFLNLPKTQVSKLYNFLKGADTQYKTVMNWYQALGGEIDTSQRTFRDICFVDAKIVAAGETLKPPKAENYIAVPLVGEVGAGPGMVDQERLKSWILVYRQHHSVERRSNLLAVEIGKGQKSMVPLLYPEDIVLVDRNDWGENTRYAKPGNIYLVREPRQDGAGGKIKRVSIAGHGEEQTIIFTSENAEDLGPEPHKMSEYNYNIRNAIIGKVIWAWSDLTGK